jgi:DNA repair exonuclease SbcCD ATPase subunit
MAELPVVPLNFAAMKSLLTENRKLRDQLEAEKSGTLSQIARLKEHVLMAERLVPTNMIPKDLHQQFLCVSSTLDANSLRPALVRRKPGKSHKDLSEDLRAKGAEWEALENELLELSQQRTALALEEQQLNADRTAHFQELSAAQQQCDELIMQKHKLEREVADLDALAEFWRQRNQQSETSLEAVESQLEALRQEKSVHSLELLQELQSMYETLEEASEFVPK